MKFKTACAAASRSLQFSEYIAVHNYTPKTLNNPSLSNLLKSSGANSPSFLPRPPNNGLKYYSKSKSP